MELITRSGAVAAARATLRLHPQDDVLIARQALVPGLELPEEGVQVREPVPAGARVRVVKVDGLTLFVEPAGSTREGADTWKA